ncbi:hypothetical protein MXAN_1880 [Myxococcus xanthus DK 1622]|uniref:Uncharacterized protein n=1 Tax=Myxococcus xanthus (strain DK1622) TaxID=246197 RepID=Q1DB47_MYXXD|nr:MULTISPECIES: hypothetical protein [Myxococcus]ABF91427.1 hypothetical protein MXAN_1880 [Myxococcus xanthus DK 1622]NOJ57777.1 hypothetical protein [Myxococcus xanthus]QPM81468.1 hypothetical protein I5Q59_09350 [Myxococcus xanthus]QVW70718.1 hypothetical protein JTM82_14710 [Myxococcus xanthus DZ2]QZZ49626.1 hypothetical protein MyxoNM_10455 [Myxococcus xanthus]
MRTATRNNFERDETFVRFFARIDGHRLRVVGRGDSGPEEEGRSACLCCECAGAQANDYIRLPGLFRRWEIQHVVDADADFNVEPAGCAEDGTELFSMYRRAHPTTTHCQKEE